MPERVSLARYLWFRAQQAWHRRQLRRCQVTYQRTHCYGVLQRRSWHAAQLEWYRARADELLNVRQASATDNLPEPPRT